MPSTNLVRKKELGDKKIYAACSFYLDKTTIITPLGWNSPGTSQIKQLKLHNQ